MNTKKETLRPGPVVLLWLLVVNLGIAFGAGVYESRIVVPEWRNQPPTTWPNTGLLFWVYVTTIPLTVLTLLNGIAAWRERGSRRRWWLSAVGVLVCERATTFGYFIPAMVRLMEQKATSPAVVEKLEQWLSFDYGRHALTFAAWMLALRALTMPTASTASHRGK